MKSVIERNLEAIAEHEKTLEVMRENGASKENLDRVKGQIDMCRAVLKSVGMQELEHKTQVDILVNLQSKQAKHRESVERNARVGGIDLFNPKTEPTIPSITPGFNKDVSDSLKELWHKHFPDEKNPYSDSP